MAAPALFDTVAAMPPALLALLAPFVLAALVLASTRLVTTLRCHWVLHQHRAAAAARDLKAPRTLVPPPIPYTVPFLGHAFVFTNPVPGAFWSRVFRRMPRATGACSINLGGRTMHIIFAPAAVQAVFRHRTMGRYTFNRDILLKGMGASLRDADRYYAVDAPPDAAGVPPKQRLEEMNRDFLLRSDRANEMTAHFMGILREKLGDTAAGPGGSGAAVEVGLFEWLWPRMFAASTTALMGGTLLATYPGLPADFDAFNAVILTLFFGTPRLLAPAAYATRARTLDGLERWLRESLAASRDTIPPADDEPAWDPVWGSRANRAKQRYYQARGLSLRGRAALDLGFLFGLSSNAIPATAWMLLRLLDPAGDPTLLPRVMEELRSVPLAADGTPDVGALAGLPLLQSVWSEVLRLYVDVFVTRDVPADGLTLPLDDTGCRQARLAPGDALFAPSWLAHRDPAAWPGTPADGFWGDRFVTTDAHGKATFSTGGTAGKFVPFGGGRAMCPGRVFAKQEVLGAVALVLLTFDFEFLGFVDLEGKPTAGFPGLKSVMSGGGVIPPGGDMRVRITRR